MDIQFMKDYYDLRYEETDGENHFVDEAAYQEKQSEHSKMEDQLMEMVGGTEPNVWKLYESIMCVYFDMEEIIKQAVYLQGAYDRERMLKREYWIGKSCLWVALFRWRNKEWRLQD